MTSAQEKKLDQLQEAYRRGEITPQEFGRKAFELKDGDNVRKDIMKKVERFLPKPTS